MTPYQDYPRMMFHRSGLTTVVLSRGEEDELGADWQRTVWPAEVLPLAEAPEPPPASAAPELKPDDTLTMDVEYSADDPWLAKVVDPPEASAFEPAPKKRARKKNGGVTEPPLGY